MEYHIKYPGNIPKLKATASVIKVIKNISPWEKSEIADCKFLLKK